MSAGGERAGEFYWDVKELRRRARALMEADAVPGGEGAGREKVVRLLNTALATELVCALRYRRHHVTARGIHAPAVAEKFLEHAREEQEHADRIARRIVELAGAPDFNPHGLATRSHGEYREGGDLSTLIREDLVAERIAIESYREMVHYVGARDPASRRILERVLATEEEHARELLALLERLGAREAVAALAAAGGGG
jgi:bacterioferritin